MPEMLPIADLLWSYHLTVLLSQTVFVEDEPCPKQFQCIVEKGALRVRVRVTIKVRPEIMSDDGRPRFGLTTFSRINIFSPRKIAKIELWNSFV
jgi:hypothetical protein